MGTGQGTPPDIPEELHILAGEYVLGVLDAAEMRAVRRRAREDAALGAAIADWERRLAPLGDMLTPRAPPPALWDRLERSIAELPPEADWAERPELRALPSLPRPVDPPRAAEVTPLVPRRGRAPRPRRVWPWQFATAASLALAAALALPLLVPAVAVRLHLAPPEQYAALVPTGSQTGGSFLALAQPGGAVVLTALATVQVPAGHDLELWILRPGETTPGSLGVLPAGGRDLRLPSMPPDGTQLMISLEPPGGSPTGAPSGPVLYAGALARMAI